MSDQTKADDDVFVVTTDVLGPTSNPGTGASGNLLLRGQTFTRDRHKGSPEAEARLEQLIAAGAVRPATPAEAERHRTQGPQGFTPPPPHLTTGENNPASHQFDPAAMREKEEITGQAGQPDQGDQAGQRQARGGARRVNLTQTEAGTPVVGEAQP